ncbi:MAG TPA: tetratricopeptide repeat protein [Edaphobacter sp.]|nr:tetratricopeptide repeat protein [Edaphobacter sp.]
MSRISIFPALVLTFFLLAALSYGEDYSSARRAAGLAISSHQNRKALTLLAPLLKLHPQDPSLWTLRGLALDGIGRTGESLSSFDRALSIDKNFAPALEGASQIAYLHGDPRALRYVQQLLVIAPENEVANAMAGALSYLSHDCGHSAEYFKRSGDAVYRDQHALSEFADCLLKEQDVGHAVQVLSRGVQQHPDSVQLKYNLAVAQLQNRAPDEAIKILAPLSAEKDSGLLNLLAYAYTKVNRPDDAFQTLERAIEISPDDEANYLDLAILCLEHHQENRSILAATAGIARIPQSASLLLIRGVAYAQLADYNKAESDFAAAARVEPDEPHSTIAMSLLYSDRGQLDKEKALLKSQLKVTPNDAVTNYLLADLLVRGGAKPGQPEFDQARAYLATSLAARPDSAEAQIMMGKLLEQESDLTGALDHYRAALKVDPENRSALDRDFLILRKLHRNSEAAEVLARLQSVLNSELRRERMSTQVRTSSDPSRN